MSESPQPLRDALRYKRSRFVARFPRDRHYSTSHHWLLEKKPGTWRIGYTKFAMRMLGEAVEADFEIKAGTHVELGEVVGWLEGFKAVTDLFTPVGGTFLRGNPDLDAAVSSIYADPYRRGWLFEVDEDNPPELLDAEGYAKFLDGTIDQMMGSNS